jgi:hypothetical protein
VAAGEYADGVGFGCRKIVRIHGGPSLGEEVVVQLAVPPAVNPGSGGSKQDNQAQDEEKFAMSHCQKTLAAAEVPAGSNARS